MPQIIAGVSGVNRKIKKIPLGVQGVNRDCKTAWAGVSGVNRKVFQSGWEATYHLYATDGGHVNNTAYSRFSNGRFYGQAKHATVNEYPHAGVIIDFKEPVPFSSVTCRVINFVLSYAGFSERGDFRNTLRWEVIAGSTCMYRDSADFSATSTDKKTFSYNFPVHGNNTSNQSITNFNLFFIAPYGDGSDYDFPRGSIVFNIDGEDHPLIVPDGTAEGTVFTF